MADEIVNGGATTTPPAGTLPITDPPNASDAGTPPGTGTPPGEQKEEGAPEQYADFAAPEGVELYADVVTDFKAVAKELNLSQNAAQKLVDTLGPKIAKQQQEQMAKVVESAHTQWAEAAKADPEYGGAKFEENLAFAKQALSAYGTPEFSKLLKDSGLGNHPEVIRFCVRAGKELAPDPKIIQGGAPGAKEKTAAEVLFG